MIRRREFITLVGGAAAWPFVARAQQRERTRRMGVLIPYSKDDYYAKVQFSALLQGLADLGWVEGRTLQMDVRWAAGNSDLVRAYAKELVALQPDVIFAEATPLTAALQRETQTIPIVFALVSDPVGSRFVASLASPGGNITGVSNQYPTMAGKWVELLTEIDPSRKRVAAMFNPETAPYVGSYYLPHFEAAVRALNKEPIVARVQSIVEMEAVITSIGRDSSGSLILMPDAFIMANGASIISLTGLNKVPAVFQSSFFARDGLLISYGPDLADLYRRAAPYVDRILRGAKPAELPVQLPVKFEMVVNTKTAKALGLTIPPSILGRADEVIE